MLSYKHLKEVGDRLGISCLGVSPVAAIKGRELQKWLDKGYQGQMSYMERNLDKRLDPSKLLSGAESVISIFVNYHQPEIDSALDGVISKYARSVDYHVTLKNILHELAGELFADKLKTLTRKQRGLLYRAFVDSAPVLEKYWAVAAGIGWQGKHSNIINRDYGSWGFLGELITTEKFDRYDQAIPDYCGSCTACIDACPTAAIEEPYQVNGSKCISYATIELPAEQDFPEWMQTKKGEWLFGCDICQDVCPWNNFAQPSLDDSFKSVDALSQGTVPDFHNLNEAEFEDLFKTTPLERPGLKGMQRNQRIKD